MAHDGLAAPKLLVFFSLLTFCHNEMLEMLERKVLKPMKYFVSVGVIKKKCLQARVLFAHQMVHY